MSAMHLVGVGEYPERVFHPNNQCIAFEKENHISVWQPATGRERVFASPYQDPGSDENFKIHGLAVSATGKLVAVWHTMENLKTNVVQPWDIESGAKMGQHRTNLDIRYQPISFSHDSRYLECRSGRFPLLPVGTSEDSLAWSFSSKTDLENTPRARRLRGSL
ncbi:hypothetical protein B0T25DRAFT_30668 [Lasiosphaeria hispida]|uniref:Uncharacterized protein n=1 Tax=Lasiosphaeria hispida TaxID=260671 RepID=A0AAJ0MJT0_9PEZI|nr:hypothetical protein B0T25DRAFT_30668 [Lasiosphaeria hispida]